jgi:sugar phosphate permease
MFESFDNKISDRESNTSKIKKDNYQSILDKILCEYGYRCEIWKIIICTLMIYIMIGFSGTIFASLLMPFSDEFKLSEAEIAFIGFTFFMIKAIGGLFAGNLSILLKSRVNLLNICLILIMLSNLTLAYTMNIYIFYFDRVLSGYVSGVVEPIINNLLCENLPTYFRGFTLLAVWMGYNLGQLYPNIIMIFTMPHYETSEIYKVLILCGIMHLITIIMCGFFLKDSPRNLILHEREEEAFSILEKMRQGAKLEASDKNLILTEIKQGVNQNISSASIWEIFKPETKTLIIFVSLLAFICDFVYDGTVLIMTKTLDIMEGDKSNRNLLRDCINVILFTVPSSIFGGFLTEFKTIGRKKTMLINFIFLIIASILSVLFYHQMFIFLGFYQFFANYGSIMMNAYSSEVFPSRIRDFAVGMCVFFSNFGSATSQYAFIYLRDYNEFYPYYLTIFCCLIGGVFSCLLSIETYQRPLDYNSKIEKELELISDISIEKKITSNEI